VLDGVVGGVIELLNRPMEIFAPLSGHVQFDRDGTRDLHRHTWVPRYRV
jgi:hypothetical protein